MISTGTSFLIMFQVGLFGKDAQGVGAIGNPSNSSSLSNIQTYCVYYEVLRIILALYHKALRVEFLYITYQQHRIGYNTYGLPTHVVELYWTYKCTHLRVKLTHHTLEMSIFFPFPLQAEERQVTGGRVLSRLSLRRLHTSNPKVHQV